MKSLACTFVCLLLAASVVYAQGVGSSGEITGTVTDASGAVLPNVTVNVVDNQTGLKRTAMTNGTGQFRAVRLSPATYDVSVERPGFATEIRRSVTVAIGQTVISDFKLKPSQVATVVEVTDQPPVVETERGSQADRISQQYITDLPIDRRDYLTFTLLVPGVSDATRLAGDQDFRVKQTPTSGLSFYGSNGRGNSVTVDGGETSGDSGGQRLTVSQDAVQEFQINRSNYAAELGSATGASINIVTKSGTNNAHGSLYGFFRNDAMDARDPFAFNSALATDPTFSNFNTTSVAHPIKNSLSRQQYGGAIGFPIQKDKTFLFASFEGLRQNSQNSVPLLTDSSIFAGPSAAATTNPFGQSDSRFGQQAIVSALAQSTNPSVPCLNLPTGGVLLEPAPVCAFALQGILSVNPTPGSNPFVTAGQSALNAFLVNQFETQGGVFPYDTREYLASGRLDHRFNVNNELSISYRYGHDVEQSPDVQSLTAFSAGSSIHTYDNNLQAAWYREFTPTMQNEARVQLDYNSFNVIPNEPGQVGLQIPSFINNLGTNIFLPNITILRRYEFADNFTVIRGHHAFKFGGSELLRGNHTESHTFFPGRFVFGSLPGFLISPCLAATASANPCTGVPSSGATINPLQSASFGLPQVYQQGFGNPTYPYYTRPLTELYAQDSWKITPSFTLDYGLRYTLDTQFAPLTTYKKDFAPRVSFAWDPFKNHKTVIRGGYGIFYGPVDVQIPDVDLSLGVVNGNKTAVENSSGAGQVANLTAICGFSQFGVTIIPGSGSSPCNREISIYVDPLGGVPALGLKGPEVMFPTLFAGGTPNNLIACTTPAAGNNACITPAAVAQFGINVTNSGPVGPLQVVFVNQPGYRPPIAQQASFGIEREIGPGFSISLSGIYSHTQRLPVAIDTNLLPAPFSTVTLANGRTVSYRNWNTGAADPLGGIEGLPCATPPGVPDPCVVNALVVQNNQYSSEAYALYEGGIVEVKKRFSEHFTLFGNYTFSKGFDTSTDFNSDYGPQDPTNLNLDRALSEFDERHKVVIAGVIDSPLKQGLLSGFQLAPIFSYHSGHPFNLLAGGEVNGDNHTTNERPIGAPRDTGLGPNYVDFDMRLSWRHKLGERANLQITAEGFNLANRTNFASVNNEVGPVFGLIPGFTTFNVHGVRPGTALAGGGTATPSMPLTFTSAFPKRQIQLGLRLTF
ncbi:MAG TPA: TonB-dependent receptor [Candidatus Dormibacteraeota bacterium]|nr:TonB-dependent receptor [Candidatus Dormibacteraeota bacterium]